MQLGDILIANGLVAPDDIAAAVEAQSLRGGRLGDILVNMGKLSPEDLDHVLQAIPAAPRSLAETGLERTDLLDLLTKAVQAESLDTAARAAKALKLPQRLVQDLGHFGQQARAIAAYQRELGRAVAVAELDLRRALEMAQPARQSAPRDARAQLARTQQPRQLRLQQRGALGFGAGSRLGVEQFVGVEYAAVGTDQQPRRDDVEPEPVQRRGDRREQHVAPGRTHEYRRPAA